jgi:beta-xylosidase
MIKKKGSKLSLEMTTLSVKLSQKDKVVENVDEKTIESIDLSKLKTQNSKLKTIWLRIDADFNVGRDIATFFYSTDGETWTQMGGEYKMRFDWQRFFMGSKFALFCYATKKKGGWLDVDAFNYQRNEE